MREKKCNMGNATRFVLIMAVMFGFTNVKAYNPYTSSVIVENRGNDWFLQITASQVGAYEVLEKYYNTKDLSILSIEAYNKLYIDYLVDHINLVADDVSIGLSPVGTHLGSQQAEVRFVLNRIPDDFDELSMKLNIFGENGSQQNVTSFFSKKGNVSGILNSENEFAMHIAKVEGQYMLSDGEAWTFLHLLYLGLLSLFTLVLFFVLRYNTNKKSDTYKGPVVVYKRQ